MKYNGKIKFSRVVVSHLFLKNHLIPKKNNKSAQQQAQRKAIDFSISWLVRQKRFNAKTKTSLKSPNDLVHHFKRIKFLNGYIFFVFQDYNNLILINTSCSRHRSIILLIQPHLRFKRLLALYIAR